MIEFMIIVVVFLGVAYYALEGLWALGLWKMKRNIRRREERALQEETVHDGR